MNAIATVCNKEYSPLLKYWLSAIRKVSNTSIFVLCLNEYNSKYKGINTIKVNPIGNPFPLDKSDHACAEKIRLFKFLPKEINSILFIDVDILILKPFWEEENFFSISRNKLVICPDLFVGYKEKMEEEFRPYDPNFRMKFKTDGSYFYFNTGVFFSSREKHEDWFGRLLCIWKDYVDKTLSYPSIFDQNVFNYCLIKDSMDIFDMPIINNCLRQYQTQHIDRGKILLNNQVVNAYHFNGGDALKKLRRWKNLLLKMETSHDNY